MNKVSGAAQLKLRGVLSFVPPGLQIFLPVTASTRDDAVVPQIRVPVPS